MPLFLDIHRHVLGLTKDVAETAHQKDLATQDKHNANYLKYWFNERTGDVFCLVEAPDKGSRDPRAPRGARTDPR